ncbi:unnamed protein product [Polarella glacialis]|uniref:Uncharacterized protein n=1 Tax=Polarella glacialis TaxID=89957 RepID=A0A813JE25_POLGL|nr:unnamed protein product [Polarella glacialis]
MARRRPAAAEPAAAEPAGEVPPGSEATGNSGGSSGSRPHVDDSESTDGAATLIGARMEQSMTMFAHMFQRRGSLTDLRRRSLTLIDVISESHLNGPLKPHRVLAAIAVTLVYWRYLGCR